MQETRFNPWVGKVPWKRECNPLYYSCLENPMDRGDWQATVHGVAKTQMRLNSHATTFEPNITHNTKVSLLSNEKSTYSTSGSNHAPINFMRYSDISKEQWNFSYFACTEIFRHVLTKQINKH